MGFIHIETLASRKKKEEGLNKRINEILQINQALLEENKEIKAKLNKLEKQAK